MTTDGRRSSHGAGRPTHRTPPQEPPVEHRTRYPPGPTMSVSLVVSAAYLDELPASTKLVLMALADSADDDGTGSIPGLAKLRAWSGLGKSRVLEVLAELVDAGWVTRTGAGRRGQRAEFHVFPRGVPTIPTAAEVAARFESGPADPSTGNPQVGTTAGVIPSPTELGSDGPDATDPVRVRSDPGQGPPDRTPSLQPFGQDRATPRVRTAPLVDSRPRAGSAGSSPEVRANNGPAERPVAEVLAETRRTKPADTRAAAAAVRAQLAAIRATATATVTEEPTQ